MIEYDLRNAERENSMVSGTDPQVILNAVQAAVADGGGASDLLLLEYHPSTQAEISIEGTIAIETHLREQIKVRAQGNFA
jgi:hypothetical protein